MSTTVLDRFLDPVTDCLTPAVAERIVGVRVDPQTQTRLDELAEKANLGQLTEEEREEYTEYVEGMDDATLDLSGPADFGAGLQDASMFALIGAGATSWKLKPNNAAANSATNPEFQQDAILTDYSLDFDVSKEISFSASAQRTGATPRAVV